jgi:hypothetical protein
VQDRTLSNVTEGGNAIEPNNKNINMSLSNPTESTPNPSKRWFQLDGKKGGIEYYDKAEKKAFEVKLPFTFIVLDTLATIKGFHKQNGGIYSNEVRDVTKEPFLVKWFKGNAVIAEGMYKDIKDKVNVNKGHYSASVYIAFSTADGYHIGNIQFKGAALNQWVEFQKLNKGEMGKKAVRIIEFKQGGTADAPFAYPVFSLFEVKPETIQIAIDLDIELQKFLNVHLGKKTIPEQVAESQDTHSENINQEPAMGLSQEDLDSLPF